MKREYFGMLFLIGITCLILLAFHFFGEEKVQHVLSKYVVIWILIAYQVGQYSMKFPKSF